MYKLKSGALAVTSAVNLSLANAVYVCADNAGIITIAANSGTSEFAGTIKVAAGQVLTLAKAPTDTIACSASMTCTSIAFHY